MPRAAGELVGGQEHLAGRRARRLDSLVHTGDVARDLGSALRHMLKVVRNLAGRGAFLFDRPGQIGRSAAIKGISTTVGRVNEIAAGLNRTALRGM